MFGREIEGKESFVQITTYLLNSAFLNDDVFSIAFKCLLQRHPWLPGVFCSYEVQGIWHAESVVGWLVDDLESWNLNALTASEEKTFFVGEINLSKMLLKEKRGLLVVEKFKTDTVFACLLKSSERALIRSSGSDFEYASHCRNGLDRHWDCNEDGADDSGRRASIEFDKYEWHFVLNLVVALWIEVGWDAWCWILLRYPCSNPLEFEAVRVSGAGDIRNIIGDLLVCKGYQSCCIISCSGNVPSGVRGLVEEGGIVTSCHI